MNAIQTAVLIVVDLLVAGSYDTLESITRERRISSRDMERVIREYGRTLAPLPLSELERLDIVRVVDEGDPTTLDVVVPLYTEEEGLSDLMLRLRLQDEYRGAYEIELLDLRVF